MLAENFIAEDCDVKRDMELVRKICLVVQDKQDLRPQRISVEGYDDLLVGRHIELLYDAGFLDALASEALNDPYRRILVKDLTWDGHEFIGSIAKEELWEKLKAALGPNELAGMSLKAVKDAAIAAATVWIKGKLGV